jgi:ankyrin repeat protein
MIAEEYNSEHLATGSVPIIARTLARTFGKTSHSCIVALLPSKQTPCFNQPSIIMSDNQSIVYDAAKSQNWAKVMELCASNPSRCAKYAGPSDGTTALHLACKHRCEDPEVFEVLVEASPEVLLVQDNAGMVPLHYACRFQASTEVVGRLLHLSPELGHAAVSKRDEQGKTPLFYAELYGAPPDVVDVLRGISPASNATPRAEQEDRFDTRPAPSLPKPDVRTKYASDVCNDAKFLLNFYVSLIIIYSRM